MDFIKRPALAVWNWLCLKIIPNIHWNWLGGLSRGGKYWLLTDDDWNLIEKNLEKENLIVCTRRRTHLTTYLESLGSFVKTGKLGYWSHALMNLESEGQGFKLVEATAIGTAYAPFEKVFDCDSVILLRPKGYTCEDWAEALQQTLSDLGKGYDTLFDISQNKNLSCVELCRDALSKADDYATDFSDFEALIKKVGDLTPDMVANCKDFDVVLEIRR